METTVNPLDLTVGVLALQGDFLEHIVLLREAAETLCSNRNWTVKEVRTASELESCDALVIPGGESTAISLIAQRTCLLEPLREFVKVSMKPTWGTCAGLILLAEAANRTKAGGQELIGGLDVKVNRNHFGRQQESFEADLDLPFLRESNSDNSSSSDHGEQFRAIFIRAPVVQNILTATATIENEADVVANATSTPTAMRNSKLPRASTRRGPVEILARLSIRTSASTDEAMGIRPEDEAESIIAVKQENVFGTSFHPELTRDARIHVWWLRQVLLWIDQKRSH